MSVGEGQVLSSAYKWKIVNYSSYVGLETGKFISSLTFNVDRSSWYLRLYPNGDKENMKGKISIFLKLKNDVQDDVEFQARYALSLLNGKNEVIRSYCVNKIGLFTKKISWGASFAHELLLKKHANININTLNEITVLCEIITENAKLYKTILSVSSDRLRHFAIYTNLLKNPKLSDVKITVEGKEIPAHKMVLAANSTVFAAMFEHKMRENEENKVTIEDISYRVFHELLVFMYTGKCTLSKEFVSELFVAADKYQILELKSKCEEKLWQNISVENSITLLQLADMHSANSLKEKAIDFIALHGKEIIERPDFLILQNLHQDLFRDVFRVVFAHVN